MRRPKKLSRSKSRKNFKKGTGVHKKNAPTRGVMRGGIRL